ncbi:MAG: Type II site-specific deoxyribonuclease() [uncultured Sulfurovum sp.]|uniref:Type II site-specific deoxyribonuclease( ) n=1 Tax=uncultured Sulfurovum sp. TaxID=269237 RepID=A0A6S6T3T7_9BACT|nr:MAG: Type II site-specific deoxyribonuclease() [uncultured Sulfurovum sp.]
MSNILRAFINIVENYQVNINSLTHGNNRANNMGEGLEAYIKDVFAGTINESDEQRKLEQFEKVYSFQGNKNNPPDLMLKNSDAIEIKKLESKNSAIALNSSYPKAKIYADSPMITKACRACGILRIQIRLLSIFMNMMIVKSFN